jgi:hypothetical protein
VTETPTVEYVHRRFDQIEAAIAQHDGGLAMSIIQLVADDGYPDLADQIFNGLIERGLNHLVARAGSTQ